MVFTAMLQFPALAQPKQVKGSNTSKYSAQLILKKDDPKTQAVIDEIKARILHEAEAAFGTDAKVILKRQKDANKFVVFKDGDEIWKRAKADLDEDPDSEITQKAEKNASYNKGTFFLTASSSSKFRPEYANFDCTPITDPADIEELFYPGVTVRAVIKIAAYSVDVNRGVTCYLQGLQIVKHTPRLDTSGGSAAQFFEPVAIESVSNDTEVMEDLL